MLWSVLAGLGACANAGYFIANKKFLERIHPDVLAATGFLFTSIVLLGISAAQGFPEPGPLFIPAILTTSAINVLATILVYRTLASTDISLAIPMLSFTPVFLIATAALILHEAPSWAGMAGIFLIVIGSYVLNTSREHTRPLDPFRAIVMHRGVLSMLVVAFLYAVAINFDKIGVQNSDPAFSAGVTMLLIGLAFIPIAWYRGLRGGRAGPNIDGDRSTAPLPGLFPLRWREIVPAGMITAGLLTVEGISINIAYTQQIAPYVIAIKRMSIILVVLAGTLFLHEKEFLRRFAGSALMVGGAALILLFS